MLAWITTDENKRQQKLVNVLNQQLIIIRGKYFAYTQITLKCGKVIKPYTLTWVKQEAKSLPEKQVAMAQKPWQEDIFGLE